MTRNHHHPGGAVPADGYLGEIPPADRQPGLALLWPAPVQPALDSGVREAERWRRAAPQGYLWTLFVYARQEQSSDLLRTAFEVGFLTRLQQGVGQMPLDGLAHRF
jgi:hypothetical protein